MGAFKRADEAIQYAIEVIAERNCKLQEPMAELVHKREVAESRIAFDPDAQLRRDQYHLQIRDIELRVCIGQHHLDVLKKLVD